MIIPIRTESAIRRTPITNYVLIGVELLAFLLLNERVSGPSGVQLRDHHLGFDSSDPSIYQFVTYQFLHADPKHLFGNMLFLWVFGNSVNAKMGNVPYLLFYLSGGVFAAWGYALVNPVHFELVGASGAIAAVTAAYVALFPRSHVTVLVWFFIIHFFEVPAMLLIGLKIIVWDNLIAPGMGGDTNVAYYAHLAGYLFGFLAVLLLLLIRALPRDQFDILALWKQWNRRREMAAAMTHAASLGTVGRAPVDPHQRTLEERRLDDLSEIRGRIGEALERRDLSRAADLYERLMALDPRQCLSELYQFDVAREFYRTGRFSQAAAAFERLVECYPQSREMNDVRLLLGIIYARDLGQLELADKHLAQTMETLQDDARRLQCARWLREVRATLGGT